MNRINPFGSLLGFALLILLLIGLAISLWFNRGLAFNPGPVTAINNTGNKLQGYASHAEFEKQCSYCHQPLLTNLAANCKDCHTEVGRELQENNGIHAKISNVNECGSCHPEHLGRDFNPTAASYRLFNHSNSSFSLIWHQQNYDASPMACIQCHNDGDFSIVNNQICVDCHRSNDKKFSNAHIEDFGSNCQDCHDGKDRMQDFNHSETGFSLEGKHDAIKCTDCHTSDQLIDTPNSCSACHAEPSVHQGVFIDSCDTCHKPDAWSPAILNGEPFSHFSTTGFSLALHQLDYVQKVIQCNSCHVSDLNTFDNNTCINCHGQHDQVFMNTHQEQFGSGCLVCHDGIDRLSNFNHASFFPLEGKHFSAQCTDCHKNNVYRGTSTECWQCHQEPEIHAGIFGLKCYYCHGAEVWSPATLQQHTFPLNHGLPDQGAQLNCNVCHGANYIDYSCYNCHEHLEEEIIKSHQSLGIAENEIAACANCHPDGIISKAVSSP